MDENLGSYRVLSRLACNYAVPGELRVMTGEENEDKVADKPEVLAKLKADPDKFLSEKALKVLSPKFLKVLKNIQESPDKNQFVYSQYRELEGLGVFSAVLEANGWQPYKIVKTNGQWVEGEMDPAKGYLVDYGDIKKAISPVYDALDHRCLNEIAGLENPTAEMLAKWVWDRLKPTLPLLSQVIVFETCTSRCVYEGR
jgi:hypothetical protein